MECLFDTSTTAIEHPTDKFITFYNTSLINITDLYPRVLGLGDREIEIRGTGLSQTGMLNMCTIRFVLLLVVETG